MKSYNDFSLARQIAFIDKAGITDKSQASNPVPSSKFTVFKFYSGDPTGASSSFFEVILNESVWL